jgi:hypothetical protein
VTNGVWWKFSEPITGISREGKREGSACYHLRCSVEVHVGTKIIPVLHEIFKACVKWNLRDFKLLRKTSVGHILGEWRGSLL